MDISLAAGPCLPGAHPGWGRPIVCPETHATRNHPLTRDLRTRKAKYSGMYMRARAYTHTNTSTHTPTYENVFLPIGIARRERNHAPSNSADGTFSGNFAGAVDHSITWSAGFAVWSRAMIWKCILLIESNSWQEAYGLAKFRRYH